MSYKKIIEDLSDNIVKLEKELNKLYDENMDLIEENENLKDMLSERNR